MLRSVAISSICVTAVNAVSGENIGKCGVATSEGEIQKNLDYIVNQAWIGDVSHFNFMGYGGSEDPCTLNIQNDADDGLDKNPLNCNTGVLFLWDEPFTQGDRGHGDWKDPSVQVQRWRDYVSRWSSELQQARSNGMMVTSPMFTDGSGGVSILDKFSQFLGSCSGCNDANSNEYINILVWTAWIGSWNPSPKAGGDWIQDQARSLKASHNNRPVWLGNFGYIGSDATAQKQIDVIWQSGVYDAGSAVDSVYYFGAADYGGGIPLGSNYLWTQVGESTIGQELVKKCIQAQSAGQALLV